MWPSPLPLPGVLCLLEHDEEYVFTLPSAYARSILTVPWVELGGKVSISCAKSGYSATVTFHTKPFYGGKVHRWASLLSVWRRTGRQWTLQAYATDFTTHFTRNCGKLWLHVSSGDLLQQEKIPVRT